MWVLLGFALLAGCSIDLRHGDLVAPSPRRAEQVWASWRAEGDDSKQVGGLWFSILRVEVVEIDGSAREQVGSQIRGALEHVGYRVNLVNRYLQPTQPTVTCVIKSFWFSGVVLPLVPVWGKIELVVALQSSAGRTLWSREVRGSGLTFNVFDGFNVAASQAMTEILNQLVREFSGDEFHRALTQDSD